MKTIFFTALFLISSLSLYSENCYKPAGHIECLLDLNSEKAVEKMLKNVYDKYKKAGVSENKMSLGPVILNGHKGMQFVLTEFQGKSMIKNGVIVKDKLYEITVEGLPKDMIEMQKVVEKSWNEIK